jgi:hypothetical protein
MGTLHPLVALPPMLWLLSKMQKFLWLSQLMLSVFVIFSI